MIYDKEHSGKCSSCGYLSIRYKQQHPQIPRVFHLEIDSLTRKNGEAPNSGLAQLACFHRLVDFSAEVAKEIKESKIERPEATVKRIQATRGDSDEGCPLWTAYQHGLDPKEHFEEFKMNQLYKFQLSLLTNQHTANLDVANKQLQCAEKQVEYGEKLLEYGKEMVHSAKVQGRNSWIIFGVVAVLSAMQLAMMYFSTRPLPAQAPIIFQYKPNNAAQER